MKISIYGKCNDMCDVTIEGEFGEVLFENTGYAPNINALCGGDDIEFEIDNATGQIIGWVPLTKAAIRALKEEDDEDEDVFDDEDA